MTTTMNLASSSVSHLHLRSSKRVGKTCFTPFPARHSTSSGFSPLLTHPTQQPSSAAQLSRNKHAARVHSTTDDGFSPYPFCASDYLAVKLLKAPYGPMRSADTSGMFVLPFHKADDSDTPSDSTPCMEVMVGGDTARCLLLLLDQQRSERPMSIELLWKVLQRGMSISKKEWKLLRVAVVGVTNAAYVARLFFGDAETGEVAWDVDCRPSDGCWLALTCGAPILVKKAVWTEYAVALRDTQIYKLEQQSKRTQMDVLLSTPWALRSGTMAWRPRPKGRGGPIGTDIEIEDPEEIKLLKREMEVAVSEEDYGRAKALREHPYMRLYTEMRYMYLEGAEETGASLQRQLADMIQANQRFGVDRDHH